MATVSDAHLRTPKVHGPDVSAGAARAFFLDGHVHALLLVSAAGVLVSVVERGDLEGVPDAARARSVGRLAGRVAGPGDDLEETRQAMATRAQRRLAVVDRDGVLLGLLCLKRHGRGFCSAADVAARDAERAANQVG
ncbi:CBS domain-containing protein [Actinomycetospora termitidis]|uniref:CBS domain-containing protein n=1 Tax=Actinomycetospora termitidis TaxID=3053470 RepID=A0ABT7M167_9PSEU|nr:CBS domain-containing protein [Actinomycetospora sp. Odt1-22]MDL5154402.1 CBS domain-containing protein [Actinomycetospora sp. Odt1-22]